MLEPAQWWTLPGAPPLNATRRNLEFRTEGTRAGIIAQALGTPFLPWQQYAADVAGELWPDGTYRYKVVVVTVPRQSGKTTLMRAVGCDRCLHREALGCFYTAQTGKDARERWADLATQITKSPLAPLVHLRRAAGNERVVFANGSMFRVFAPVANSLHGYTPPLVMLDEVFAHDEQTGDDLMGAIGPAQITIPHRQLWIVSTKGTASSVFLNRWIAAGRAGAEGVALLEWAAPDGADIYDPAIWPTYHPGMVQLPGRPQLVTAAAMQAEADRLPRAEFYRAYGNVETRTASHLISAEAWDRLGPRPGEPDLTTRRGTDEVGAYIVMPGGVSAAVVVAWRNKSHICVRVAKSGEGVGWVAPAVLELRTQGVKSWAAPAAGPASEVTDELGSPGWVRRLNGAEYAAAWGGLMRHLAEDSLRHDGSEPLAIGAANVATRPMGDSSAPSLRNSAGDVSALVALMVAAWGVDHRAPSAPLQYRT
jgi:hypothetical protein